MKEKIVDIIMSRTLFGCKFWVAYDIIGFIFEIVCLVTGNGLIFGFFAVLMIVMFFLNLKELKDFKKEN